MYLTRQSAVELFAECFSVQRRTVDQENMKRYAIEKIGYIGGRDITAAALTKLMFLFGQPLSRKTGRKTSAGKISKVEMADKWTKIHLYK